MQRAWSTDAAPLLRLQAILTISSLLKQKGGGEKRKKRDDLWALGEGEPQGYPSLSGREGGEREKKGLDGGVQGAEGEGPNGAPNHVLHLEVILGVYVRVCKVSAKQMWGSEGKSGTLVCTLYSSCVRKNCGSIGGFMRKIQLPEWCLSMFVWMCVLQ